MAVNVNSGLTVANLTTSANYKTLSAVSYIGAGAVTDQVIATVGAGKTWRIVGFTISALGAVADSISTLKLDGVTIGSVQQIGSATAALDRTISIAFEYSLAFVLAATKTITVTTTNASNRYSFNVYYVEE